MSKTLKRTVKFFLIVTPFVLGMIGYTLAGHPFLQAFYCSLHLYGMGQKELPPNVLIEIARWVGPFATAGLLLTIIKSARRHIHNLIAKLFSHSVAVYGPKDEKKAMLKALGRRGIDMEGDAVNANCFILLGSENENFDIYRTQLADKNKDVYLKCASLPEQAGKGNLHLFCPEETSARVFWEKNSLYDLATANNNVLDVVIVGFEKLGREVLLSALHGNIFDLDQKITYHIIGENNGFTDCYHELDKITDPVIFHPAALSENLELIKNADAVIVTAQKDQLDILHTLIHAIPEKQFYVFSAHKDATALISTEFGNTRLICFDWKKEAMNPANILREETVYHAKRLNMCWSGKEDGPDEEANALWADMDTFNRYSNIFAASYRHTVVRKLGNDKLEDKMEMLAELEHIRWCRYHYLNNWTLGTPDNGANKDKPKRIHTCLIPYAELSEPMKENDRKNIRYYLKINK